MCLRLKSRIKRSSVNIFSNLYLQQYQNDGRCLAIICITLISHLACGNLAKRRENYERAALRRIMASTGIAENCVGATCGADGTGTTLRRRSRRGAN
jgi:hypothetical protein